MANLQNWPLVRERQTVDCYKHNSNVYVIFTVPINSSSKLSRIKPSQLLMMSSDTRKLPNIEKIRPSPQCFIRRETRRQIYPPPSPKMAFKIFFYTFARVSYPLKCGESYVSNKSLLSIKARDEKLGHFPVKISF